MRIAIVFDDLIQKGGAENLLIELSKIYPDAPIYSCLSNNYWQEFFGTRLKPSYLNKLPLKDSLYKTYGALGLFNLYYENLNLNNFDIVFSISTRFAHNIITSPKTVQISYINSPGRMFWQPNLYFKNSPAKKILALPLTLFRLNDYISAQRSDYLIANSKTPLKRINRYWQRDSKIIYPFFDQPKNLSLSKSLDHKKYFVVLSRLEEWKKIDIAIKACNKLNIPLKIIGNGSYKNKLKSISKDNIEFVGYVSETQKYNLLYNAKALINTQYEDFGIVPLEALSVGTPVIAYEKGGVLETVKNEKTGLFFKDQTTESLIAIINKFEKLTFKYSDCIQSIKPFTKDVFMREIRKFVDSVYYHHKVS